MKNFNFTFLANDIITTVIQIENQWLKNPQQPKKFSSQKIQNSIRKNSEIIESEFRTKSSIQKTLENLKKKIDLQTLKYSLIYASVLLKRISRRKKFLEIPKILGDSEFFFMTCLYIGMKLLCDVCPVGRKNFAKMSGIRVSLLEKTEHLLMVEVLNFEVLISRSIIDCIEWRIFRKWKRKWIKEGGEIWELRAEEEI